MAKPMYYWNGTAWEAVGPEVPQSPIAYQASAPSTPSTGDLWIDSDQDLDTYQRQLVRYKFIASGGETSLSGADANSAVLSYTPGAEQVYLNGALLVRGSDYVATDGTSITSLAALSVNDVVEIFAYVAFNVANTYTQSQVDGLVAPMGLVHINTTSFSAVSSISVNDVFSADHQNYAITLNLSTGPGTIPINFRLRASGTDNTSSNYYYSLSFIPFSGTATVTGANGSGLTTLFTIGSANTGNSSLVQLFNPFESQITSYSYVSRNLSVDSASGGGNMNVTTSYDGFTIYTASGTITGTVRVYGYKK